MNIVLPIKLASNIYYKAISRFIIASQLLNTLRFVNIIQKTCIAYLLDCGSKCTKGWLAHPNSGRPVARSYAPIRTVTHRSPLLCIPLADMLPSRALMYSAVESISHRHTAGTLTRQYAAVKWSAQKLKIAVCHSDMLLSQRFSKGRYSFSNSSNHADAVKVLKAGNVWFS